MPRYEPSGDRFPPGDAPRMSERLGGEVVRAAVTECRLEPASAIHARPDTADWLQRGIADR